MSRTRALMAELAHRYADGVPAPPPRGTPNVDPPAFVHPPTPEHNPFGARAALHTTALLGIGAVGTRYATSVVLQFQAELAVAHAAVAAELPDGWAKAHGFTPLRSRAQDHREYLLRPDLGRRLSDESLASVRALRAQVAPGGPGEIDVQLILADGLSAAACVSGGEALYRATAEACKARGLRVGPPVCAKFARVWLEDEIGAELGAKVAIILLGERPGLGTGDGLSAYLVYRPQVGKTDGDRNMMSNLHARGTPAHEAAPRLAALAHAMIAQRTSGVGLSLTGVDAGGRGYRAPQERQRLVELGAGKPREAS